MSQNYAGRLTLIIVVLLIGLFGIPGLSDGIFSLKKVFDPKASFNDKLNLRPGIDIAGGTSLLYEIKPPPGGFRGTQGTLAETVASLLKKRVDPTGTLNLIWRPQGDTRLEIQIPRSSMTKEGSGNVKNEYATLKKQIDDANISGAQVISAVENLSSDARDKELKRLAAGNTQRDALFGQLRSLFDKIKNLDTQLAELRKADKKNDTKISELSRERALASIAYDDAKGRVEQA